MNFTELLQVVAVSSFLTLALVLLLCSLWRRMKAGSRRLLPPRYLQSKGVRRRSAAPAGANIS
ncbi:celllulose biosynthesis operon protein BcsF/YhjT [compost metagenome]